MSHPRPVVEGDLCLVVGPDGTRACALAPDHDGPHGWDTPDQDLRREAVARAVQGLQDDTTWCDDFGEDTHKETARRMTAIAIDASGLLDEVTRLREQLAAERALCDRLADAAVSDGLAECWAPLTEMVDEGGHLGEAACGECAPCLLHAVLDDYDAHRATEHSETRG